MKKSQLALGAEPLEVMTLWEPEAPSQSAGTLLVVHGLTEHIGRYEEFARAMTCRGWRVAGFNLPGHGGFCLTAHGAPRPGWCGGEGSWKALAERVDRALRRLGERFPGQPMALLGFSLGSFLVRAWLIDQGERPPIDRLLLLGTGDQPAWILRLVRGIVRGQCRRYGEYNSTPLVQKIAFGSYNRQIKGARSPYAWLLADPEALEEYQRDPLICSSITGGLFRELLSCMIYVRTHETPRLCPAPTLFLSGKEDPVGEMGKGVVRAAAKFTGSQVILVPGRHDILHDGGRREVYALILKTLE